jgi:alpha-D-ribose 1-methylphosphonate 5-triphosphate synthase subunit PhnI
VEGLMGTRPGGEGIGVGYGCVFGRNDTKAIAMSILDRALSLQLDTPTGDMEFVLMHGDCLEMNGFISHLKLPHYVTFQSKLDSLRRRKKEAGV